jgi:Rieske 2Fe-2S family protein
MSKTFHPTTTTYKQGAHTLPQEYYISDEIFAQEQERIFAKSWLCVGRASKLTKPGDYFLADIAGESLIITKDSFNNYRAHFNVCRHRGTRVCVEPSGHFLKHMQCPYHAWTYSTDGALVSAPHMAEAKTFDKNKFGLFQAGIAEWEGFLFVNIDPKAQPFEKAWKPMIGRLSRFGLPDVRVGHRVVYDVEANWKLVFQNYNECLHCPTMHPELSMVLPYTSGANDLIEGPFLGGYMEIRPPNESATLNGRACGRFISDTIPHDDRKRAYYYSFMPNMLLSIHPDYVNFYTLHPIDAFHTRVESEWMFHPDTIADRKNNMKSAIDFWDITNRQDWGIVQRNQLGVTSRRYVPGPYSPRESIPAAWDREYLKRMKGKTKKKIRK